MPVSDEELAICLRVLASGVSNPDLDRAIVQAHRRVKKSAKSRRSAQTRAHDREIVSQARRFQEEIPDTTPAIEATGETAGVLLRMRRCYVCKGQFREADIDYHLLCPGCAEDNRVRRSARCDLTGRTALITGGRVKLGFHTALKLLRDGAEVIVSTRFPKDAAKRFAEVPDAADWAGRLHLHGTDLLDLTAITVLIETVHERFPGGLDILINNAAQTLYRPPEYHREVRTAEAQSLTGAAARLSVTASQPSTVDAANLPALIEHYFPAGLTDETGQPLDLRPRNSWVLRDADVSPGEWLQAHVVNAFAPFLLTSRLRPLMEKSPFADRYVVQVSAMEGSYTHPNKTHRHPHTNMAKAALNMLTRTVSGDYASAGIHMNSVDTGWVTDENPHPAKMSARDKGFRPPLDVIDGAARVYDPIVRGVLGEPMSGHFLKDYRSVPW